MLKMPDRKCKAYVQKDGWFLSVNCEFREIEPKYYTCPTCQGMGEILRNESYYYSELEYDRCWDCGGAKEVRLPPETLKPELPDELLDRLEAVLKSFGEEYNDNPNWKEPFRDFGAGI